MNIQGRNSVAFCVVQGDSLLWADAMGYANRENHRSATPETRYLIASISKSITGTAIMQLYEEGYFGLDDNVNTLTVSSGQSQSSRRCHNLQDAVESYQQPGR